MIDFLVQLSCQVYCHLSSLHYFLRQNENFGYISVFILSFKQKVSIIARDMIFRSVIAFPLLPTHNLLVVVIDIENRGINGFSLVKGDSPNHAGSSKIHLMDMHFMLICILEQKVCFSNWHLLNVLNVHDIVIVNDFSFWFGSTAMSNKTKLIFSHLPHCGSVELHIILSILHPYCILDDVMPESLENIKSIEIEGFCKASKHPADHSMIVSFANDCMIICPGVFLILEYFDRYGLFGKWELKVC